MKKEFTKFCDNLKLTTLQNEDAKTKYTGVVKKLHDSYYESNFDGSTKFLFGSHKTNTNIRPITEHQDVDVLFKISEETFEKFDNYESNGQSALLQELKGYLDEKYTSTNKISGWGKVVLIKFSDNTHNVEVLPAYEQVNGTFLIPNTENGGSWDEFNPREQVTSFQNSNFKTNGLTADLCRMMKSWVQNTETLNYSSYILMQDIIMFLEEEYEEGVDYCEYHNVIKNFLDGLKNNCDSVVLKHVTTAHNRVVKAIEFIDDDKPKEASIELIKIFGSLFPKISNNPIKESRGQSRVFIAPSAPWRK